MKTGFKSTLFWQISAVFLIIPVLLGLAYVSITVYSARKYYQETTQKLNADVAQQMLAEVNPFQDGKVNKKAVGKIMHSMMAVNPSVEVYLLNPKGKILKYVVLDKNVRLKNVNLGPVKKFLDSEGGAFVMGDDPRQPGEKTIFSAAAVRTKGALKGYVYMVLASKQYEHVSEALLGSYFLRLGTQSFIITLVGAFLIGMVLIAYLTRNLRRVISTVRQFEKGDYHVRIPVKGKGEMAQLSRTFNHMADTILQNIEDLKEVDYLRRDLVANVSHDLRSPLSIIHGYIETMIMKQEELGKAERERYFKIILKSSERLKKLVGHLFELAKLESGQVEIERQNFNMNELLQDTVAQYRLMAQNKGIQIKTNLQQQVIADADIALIQRVFQNLLDNAIKYSDNNSEVQINSSRQGGKLHIAVINHGENIPQEDIPNLFNRYYKKETGEKDSTGLGLAVASEIINLHNGHIIVRSTPENETTFTVVLPAA